MRKVLQLARREYLAAVRSKGFLLGLVLAPVLMCGGFLAMVLLKDQVDTSDRRVAIVDRSGVIAASLAEAAAARNAREVLDEKTGRKLKPAYLIEIVPPEVGAEEAQRLQLSDRVRDQSLHAFVEIGPGVAHPHPGSPDSQIRFYGRNPALDEVRRWLAWPINDQLRKERLVEAGVSPGAITNLFDWVSVDGLGLVSRDPETGEIQKAVRRHEAEAVAAPLILQVLMFMLLMMGGAPLLQSVMEEKAQRIAEILLGSATPTQLLFGKLLGGAAVSLTGSTVYLVAGAAALSGLALSQFMPYHLLPWFFAYLLAAMLMFGAVFAALGSACNDSRDAQSLQLPALLPAMIPMFLLGPVLREPQSAVATGLSLFPPFTPMLMLLRQSTPEGVPAWQPWVGLAGTLLCTALVVWLGGRVFRVGILMQGNPPRLREILRWAVRG